LRQIFSLDFEGPDEIDAVRKFLRFHSKRLNCTEDKVLLELSKEFDKVQSLKVIDIYRSSADQTRPAGKTRKARAPSQA
jgi:hypothetical protein